MPRAENICVNFALLITADPYSQQAANTAYQFCRAAIAGGHHIKQIFFYQAGTHNANAYITLPSDEQNLVQLWQQLAADHNIKLVLCTAAAQNHGINEHNLAAEFTIAGLGQLIEAATQADRFLVFG